MGPYTARLLAATAAAMAVVVLTLSGAVDATVVTTCRAAASSDRRVDYAFCVGKLSVHHLSPDADTWGLAKVSADVGVVIAGDALYDIRGMLAKDKGRAGGAPRRAALERCEKLYDLMGYAFAGAYDSINARDYAAGKRKAAEAVSIARQCDGAFANAGVVPSPLRRQSADAVRIAIVCTAITNLIK